MPLLLFSVYFIYYDHYLSDFFGGKLSIMSTVSIWVAPWLHQ